MIKYLLIDEDGMATLLNKEPEVGHCSPPAVYRVSAYSNAFDLEIDVERFDVDGWEHVMEIDEDKE